MPLITFPRPLEGTGVPPPATTGFPDLTVEIGRYSGWILGDSVLSILGTTTIPGLTTLDWEDITHAVRNLSIRRGRQHELDRVEAGVASVTLMNQDGAFNATNTNSPYWPIIRPMTPLRIRASFVEEVPPPPAFVPTDIAGLVAWYDFSDITKLFQDTARTSPITADAQTILGVTDGSGNGKHLSEATNGPQYKTGIINGRSVARFDGTNDVLKNTAMTADASQTIIIVAQKRSAPGTGSRTLFGAGSTNVQLFTDSDNSATAYVWFSPLQVLSGTATSVTAAVLRLNSAASLDFYANGGTPTNFNPDDAITVATTYAYGANHVPGNFTDSDIGEVLVYNSALAAADLNTLGAYLATRWGFSWTTV